MEWIVRICMLFFCLYKYIRIVDKTFQFKPIDRYTQFCCCFKSEIEIQKKSVKFKQETINTENGTWLKIGTLKIVGLIRLV